MSNYKITDYSYNQAKKLNLIIKPSRNKNKKIDVYKNDEFIASIGNVNHSDYGNYLITYNKEYADKRRLLYHNRHQRNATVINSKQYLALNLLW